MPSNRSSPPDTGCSYPTSGGSVGRGRWAARTTDLIEIRVADLAGLVQALGLEEVALVLHDWGGPIGLAFAASHPQVVRALVVMSTWAWPEPSSFHASITPWRMLRAPVVGPHLLGRHNSLADRGVHLSVVDRARFRARAGGAYAQAMPDAESRLPTVLFPRMSR